MGSLKSAAASMESTVGLRRAGFRVGQSPYAELVVEMKSGAGADVVEGDNEAANAVSGNQSGLYA
eukprot:1164457-Pyramimonas_sp.AAC.1